MFARWVDPHVRRSIALAMVILSITGLVLADRANPRSLWPSSSPTLTIATDSTSGVPSPSPGLTAVGFHGHGAHGRFAISHSRLLASGPRSMYLEMRLTADDKAPVTRSPIAMALVVDTSGSMAGQKIQDAKRAALSLLDEMRPEDSVVLVRYATNAQVVIPLSRVSDVRERARDQISGMTASGNTDIANALRVAGAQLDAWGKGRPERIVLVTDGRDTSGAPRDTGSRVARNLAGSGVTVSALGIGADYDADYLSNMADVGRGNYEFLSDSSALARFLSKELVETGRTAVQDALARIELPANVRVRDVWGANSDSSDGTLRLSFGSLFAGDERRAIVSLDVDTATAGSWMTLRASVSWLPVGAGARVESTTPALRVDAVATADEVERGRDSSVLATATSVIASKREQEAAAAFERGDRKRAMELNTVNMADLDRAAQRAPGPVADRLRAQKRAYEGHGQLFSTSPPAAAPARAIGAAEHKNSDRDVAY